MQSIPLIVALLVLYPGPQSQCIADRSQSIAANADASSSAFGVPAEILIATAFLETHIGCDRGEGGGLGAPIDREHRHTAGGWTQHGSALALGFGRCRRWRDAVAHYRTGRCRGIPPAGYTAADAMALAERLRTWTPRTPRRGSPGSGHDRRGNQRHRPDEAVTRD